jgi:hypothetical protein
VNAFPSSEKFVEVSVDNVNDISDIACANAATRFPQVSEL